MFAYIKYLDIYKKHEQTYEQTSKQSIIHSKSRFFSFLAQRKTIDLLLGVD